MMTTETKNSILKVFSGEQGKRLAAIRLYGLSVYAEKLITIVGKNRDYYAKIDYDDFVEMLPDDLWKNFASSLSVDYLINIIKKSPQVSGDMPNDGCAL